MGTSAGARPPAMKPRRPVMPGGGQNMRPQYAAQPQQPMRPQYAVGQPSFLPQQPAQPQYDMRPRSAVMPRDWRP
jgi:hypothetical protein